jgi:hypothetical protein
MNFSERLAQFVNKHSNVPAPESIPPRTIPEVTISTLFFDLSPANHFPPVENHTQIPVQAEPSPSQSLQTLKPKLA